MTENDLSSLLSQFQDKCNALKQSIASLNISQLRNNNNTEILDSTFLNTFSHFLEIQSLEIEMNKIKKQFIEKRIENKKQLDNPLLLLKTLTCESNYFNREIQNCKNYQSKHLQVELPTIEEFKERAPKDYIKCFNELDELKLHSNLSIELMKKEHEIMMNRLRFELEEREALENKMKSLRSEQDKMKSKVHQLSKYLTNIPNNLKSLRKAIQSFEPQMSTVNNVDKRDTNNLTIQDEWSIKELKERMMALPNPLYILYNKLIEYKQVNDSSIQLKIEGDLKQVNKCWDKLKEENNEPLKKKVKINDENLFEEFPLVIQLRLPIKVQDKSSKILIEFQYLYKINLVIVNESKSSVRVMYHLILNDNGARSPSINILPDYDFTKLEKGRPYRWLQSICGLEFIPLRIANIDNPLGNKPEIYNNYSLQYILDLFKYKQYAKRLLNVYLNSLEYLDLKKNDSNFPTILTFKPKLEIFKKILENENILIYQLNIKVDKYLFECELIIDSENYPTISPFIKKLIQLEPKVSTDILSDIPEEYRKLVRHDNLIEISDMESSSNNYYISQIVQDVNEDFVKYFLFKNKYENGNSNSLHFELINEQVFKLLINLSIYVESQLPQSKLFENIKECKIPLVINNNNQLVCEYEY
ncbi:hypothetical protein ABK040_003652 [Willaertia magna]